MPDLDPKKVLFVGWGALGGVSHYRTILPARAIGAEWVVFDMNGKPLGGEGERTNHEIVVVQNCWEKWQVDMMQRMRSTGARVVSNVDDWIKTIGKMDQSHGNAEFFRRNTTLKQHERYLTETDGSIAATPWLQQRLLHKNPNVQIARNGLDLDRYDHWRDIERDQGFIIGWAGGTGHREAFMKLAPTLTSILKDYENVSLWIVGEDFTHLFPREVQDSIATRKWSDMGLYPKDLACFDVNLAPALDNDFYKAKSQLRYYEALALGNPTIAHPMYDEIKPDLTGNWALDGSEWYDHITELIEDPEKLDAMRERCLEERQHVSIEARADEWLSALTALKLQWGD